ncbi:unnamed protein product [Brachionus calyciflorus]|uniref:Uncharacterized protein n=1 Tax=Brachionus calyciflorus TaxID=104777 RepID=A0A813W499_9BILA|nr:unnamed protein product [Brachionus calyciflorus]
MSFFETKNEEIFNSFNCFQTFYKQKNYQFSIQLDLIVQKLQWRKREQKKNARLACYEKFLKETKLPKPPKLDKRKNDTQSKNSNQNSDLNKFYKRPELLVISVKTEKSDSNIQIEPENTPLVEERKLLRNFEISSSRPKRKLDEIENSENENDNIPINCGNFSHVEDNHNLVFSGNTLRKRTRRGGKRMRAWLDKQKEKHNLAYIEC